MKPTPALFPAFALLLPGIVNAAVFMDTEWAKQACDKWNQSEPLTVELGGDAFAENNAGRGYKIIHLYRDHCGEGTRQQLTISSQDGKAICTYGGPPIERKLNPKVDYLMHATDDDWACMGKGQFGCGPMGAMMSGKLKFVGPKFEVMNVIGPFESFLRLTGAVAGDTGACPK
ncbi:MAG: sterol-binding protein [Thiotrichales bacterium]